MSVIDTKILQDLVTFIGENKEWKSPLIIHEWSKYSQYHRKSEDLHRSCEEWYVDKGKERKNWGLTAGPGRKRSKSEEKKSVEDRNVSLIYVELIIKAMSTDGITGKRRAYENKKNLHFWITFYILEPGCGISYIAFHLSSVKNLEKCPKQAWKKKKRALKAKE